MVCGENRWQKVVVIRDDTNIDPAVCRHMQSIAAHHAVDHFLPLFPSTASHGAAQKEFRELNHCSGKGRPYNYPMPSPAKIWQQFVQP